MNYKKSILSLVTILALNSSVSADPNATYVPLTTNANDYAWVMFGVNNFADGTPSAVSASGVFTAGNSTVTEASTTDDLASPSVAVIATAASGTIFNDTGTKNMATFQALKDPNGTAYYTVQVTMAIKTNDLTFSETQPVRSMYIAIQTGPTDTNTISKIKLDYKSVLEGRTVEIQLNNTGTVYTATISQTATFNAPAIAKYVAPVNNNPPLTSPADTLVYDLAAAPFVAASYDKTKHQGTALTSHNERFYHYDVANGVWTLWDNNKVIAGTNTLVNFAKGNAYWGRADTTGDANASNSGRISSLYLAKTGKDIADPAIYTGNLTPDAWNMLAFDPAAHKDIRNATTGLIVTQNVIVTNDVLTVLDETGVNAVDVNFTSVATDYNTTSKVAKYINQIIEAAKLLGKVPKAFNVKAFGSSGSDIAFISDKKFTLKDKVGNLLAGATTLANQNPVNTVTGLTATVADVATTGVTSLYGEYSMIIEPLVGVGTASNIASGVPGTGTLSAKVQFGDISGDSKATGTAAVPLGLAPANTATTIALAGTELAKDNVFVSTTTPAVGKVSQISTDFNTTMNMLIAASTKPFYIKDHTYTRVYAIDSGVNGTDPASNANIAYKIKNTVSTTLVPDANATASVFVTAINAQADTNATTLVYAGVDGANLVVMTPKSSLMDLQDADSAVKDYFTKTTSSADISKGAIKQVIDVSKLARQDVTLNQKTLTFTADTNVSVTARVTAVVGGVTITPATTTVTVPPSTDAQILIMLDSLVANLNTALKAAGAAAFASHSYVSGYNDITKAVITISGVDINTTGTAFVDVNATSTLAATLAEANTNPGKIDVVGADIIADLKDNAIYTPDYVNYGPLYTLKSAGYEAKAILHASTKLAATPTTHWDAIDLTRASSDWLKNNEFNLFSVDNSSGYWVYLTSFVDANATSASNVVLTPSYAYHFNPILNTTKNIINTSAFSVAVTGSTAATSNAKLIIGGSEVQLTNTGTTYTANVNDYEAGLVSGSSNTIGIKVADGIGSRYENLNLVTLDYVKPAIPTVAFNTPISATFSDTSTDVANYYFWVNFIPDAGANATGPISPTAATSYNMCTATTYGTTTSYKLVAVDGVGTFGNANISDAQAFTFANAEKDATVLTHSFGNTVATAMRYDANCIATGTTTKSGVEVRAQQVGNVKLAYQHIAGAINATNNIPVTAYYSSPTATGTAVIQVDSLGTYAGAKFYVQYNNALYTGTFPASRVAADLTFTSPTPLTAVSSTNQLLN